MGLPQSAELPLVAEELEELARRTRRRRLLYYRPYPKQYDFHAAGLSARERLFCAGNQEGKTYAGAHELAYHATGDYPDWWTGRRYNRPILAWTGAVTDEASKEIIQDALLGTESDDRNSDDFGTGTLPYDKIGTISRRQSHVKGVINEIYVKHVSGGWSRIVLKTYAQGAAKWQGKKVDVVWLDEEPTGENADIYSEALTRTQAAEGGMLFMTRTPLNGMTPIIKAFFSPEEGSTPKSLTRMSIYECCGGVWEDGYPWAGQEWKGHYDRDQVAEIVSAWPAHERETRANGTPLAGEGLVFPVDHTEIMCAPFEIPAHFARICGTDFGISHPAAGAWLAHDRHQDIVYLYDCYRKADQTPVYHASAIKKRDPQNYIPVAWPHDGLNRGKDGKNVKQMYKAEGAKMMRESARYDDDKGGPQDPEPICLDILERMHTGRFKVFSNQDLWFEEARSYHRKNGKIVDANDDIMAATRTAMMELRHAKVFVPKRRPQNRITRPIVGGRL